MDEGECGQCFAVESTSKASSGEGRNLAKFEVENVEALSSFFSFFGPRSSMFAASYAS